MKLLVIVLCLLSERFLIHSISLQRFSWFKDYAQVITRKTEINPYFSNPWLILVALILPIFLGVSILYLVFNGVFFGFLGFLLSVLIFYYCLGPQNPFYPITTDDASEQVNIGNYFIEVNSQLFTVIFWFIIAGPLAALAYRILTLCKEQSAVSIQATFVVDILEWIPARLTAIMYLLVGNFQRGFGEFIKYVFSTPNLNDKLLNECGLHAVQITESDSVPMPVAEMLVEHATIVFLVFIALFTLVAWM
jgi:AmpE protein